MAVAVELKRRHIVVGAHPSRNRQALPCLHVPDLVEATPTYIGDGPRAGRMAVAIKLKSRHIVVCTQPSRNCQTLPCLHIPDLVDAGEVCVIDNPGTRRMIVTVELKSCDIVVRAYPTSNRETLVGLYIDEHYLIDNWFSVRCGCAQTEKQRTCHKPKTMSAT
jgi:hypothetical protein